MRRFLFPLAVVVLSLASLRADDTVLPPRDERDTDPANFLVVPIMMGHPVVFPLEGLESLVSECKQEIADQLRALQARDDQARLTAAQFFAQYGYLLALAERNAARAVRAKRILAGYGKFAGKLRELLPPLLDDVNPKLRLRAATTLLFVEPGHSHAARLVLAALDGKDEESRETAGGMLEWTQPSAEKAVPVLVQALRAKDASVRTSAIMALMKYGSGATPAVPAFLRRLASGDLADYLPLPEPLVNGRGCSEREFILQALGTMGVKATSAVPELVRLAEKAKPEKLPELLECLKTIGPTATEALPFLRRRMKDSQLSVRLRAGGALLCVRPGDREAVAMLRTAIRSPDDNTRREAARSVVGVPAGCGVPLGLLAEGLRDSDDVVRTHCLEVFARMGPGAEPVIPALASLLMDTPEGWNILGQEAGKVLAAIGKPTVPALVEIMNQGQLSSPATAREFQRLSDKDPLSDTEYARLQRLVGQYGNSLYAMTALGEIGRDAEGAVPSLVKNLRTLDRPNECAIIALGQIGSAARVALPALRAIRTEVPKKSERGMHLGAVDEFDPRLIQLFADWAIRRIEQ